MARTTSDAVSAIIEVDSSLDLTPFITTANILVTKHCAELNSDYTATELEEIERYLAAHLATLYEPRVTQEGVGSNSKVSAWYQHKIDLGLASSHYGQTAMLLDWYGGLAALNERMKRGGKRTPAITWMGTESDTLEE